MSHRYELWQYGDNIFLGSKVIFRQRSPSVKCNFHFLVFVLSVAKISSVLALFVSSSLGFIPENGIAQLGLSLFVSTSSSTFDLVHLYDLFCDE